MIDYTIKKFRESEEIIIKQVLTQLLNKVPDTEDFKKCTRVFQIGNNQEYDFYYDGILLGKIKYNLPSLENENYTLGVEFIPKKV